MKRCARISAMQILLNRRPESVPPAYWKSLLWMRFCALLYVVAWLGYGVCAFVLIANRTSTLIFLILWGVLMLILDLGPRWVQKQLRKKVVANNYQVCTYCGYGLCKLPAEHRCPECGNQYDLCRVRNEWQEWFA